ncbi:MAG: metallophosphoesterase [Micromonosporaceae bacterium]
MSDDAARQTPEDSSVESPITAARYAIGDIHGHLAELDRALHAAGLTDADGTWSGDNAAVWFLGDFSDRGPDGIGVIDRIRGLATQAEAAGGQVTALLGNHELLLLGAHRFDDQVVPITYPERDFRMMWTLNGGRQSDLDRLTDEHVEWLTGLDAIALAGDHLLMHSDTTSYLGYGDTVPEINAGVRRVLRSDDIEGWWLCARRLTARHEFRSNHGEQVADDVLARLGGRRIVHGHSTIPNHLGVDPASVTGPFPYAGGKVLAIDGGIYLGGPCLVVRLTDAPDDGDDSAQDEGR